MKQLVLGGLVSVVLLCVGCSNDVLDPTQIGRFQPVPVVNVILPSLGVADEPDPTYADAEEPRPEDLIAYEQDYTFGVGDLVRISIYELRREGFPFVNDYRVTETGRISIPDVGQVLAIGLTEKELEDEIKDILSPTILRDPSVSVLLLESQSRVFSIYGWGLGQTGRFPLPRYDDFRLTDAIALAGDVGQFNVSYIYVTREEPIRSQAPAAPVIEDRNDLIPEDEVPELKPIEPGEAAPDPEEEMLELISPYSGAPRNGIVIATAEMADADVQSLIGDDSVLRAQAAPTAPQAGERVEWIFEDGRWKPVPVEGDNGVTTIAPAAAAPREMPGPDPLDWDPIADLPTRKRVIQIPVDRLKGGDPRYDIIIRPGDRISVPGDVVGEFYIMGNVNNAGIIPMTGRPMTLKMAIAAAGGLNQLAWPKKVEVVRRLGRNESGLMQEEIVMVDLDKIARGEQPDFLIKPDDLINVGTHGVSRWLAVLRNAFRATYGFGFIYDRNFAVEDFGNDPFPGHFGFDSIF